MTKEHEGQPVPLTAIYIDISRRTVILASQDEVVATLRLAPEGLIFQSRPDQATSIADPGGVPSLPAQVSAPESPEAEQPAGAETEKPKAVTLQGKLKSKPREGRPDSRGNPTAWARFAAHEEDREDAHMYSATFHKHTARIALGLDVDTPLTVQGYPHEHDDPGSKRMDTLSVINLLDFPGREK